MRKGILISRLFLSLLACLCLLLSTIALAEEKGPAPSTVGGAFMPQAAQGKKLLLRHAVVANDADGMPYAAVSQFYWLDVASKELLPFDGQLLAGHYPVQMMTDGTFYTLSSQKAPFTLTHFQINDGKVEALHQVELDANADEVLYWHGAAVLKDVAYVLWQPPEGTQMDMTIHAYDLSTGAFIEKLPIEGAEVVTATQDRLVVSLGSQGEYQAAAVIYDPAEKSQTMVGTSNLPDGFTYTAPRRFACDPVSGTYLITGAKGFYRWELDTGAVELVLPLDLTDGGPSFFYFDSQIALAGDHLQLFDLTK